MAAPTDASGCRVPGRALPMTADARAPIEIVIIAALDRAHAIGKGNALPWHLPDDLQRFKALTLGSPVLMGRRTAQSLGRALPTRVNLVLTRSGRAPFDGMQAVASFDEALAAARAAGAGELCVIGGGDVFALALPLAARMHLTHVDTLVKGADAFFPRYDPAAWCAVSRIAHPADARHAFAFDFIDYVPVGDVPIDCVPVGDVSADGVPAGWGREA